MHEHPTPAGPTGPRVCVLSSGSSGNAVLVSDGHTTIALDAGISARETYRRAALCGIDADAISAIVVTHEHSDHVRGVRVLAKRTGAAVIASPGTIDAGRLGELAADVRGLSPGSELHVGTLAVRAFSTSHDAAQPIGVTVAARGGTFGLATDTGEITDEILEALAPCTAIGIETNHDAEMLERGPYPYFLKRRIASARGHLANDRAADTVERLAHDALERVFALHVSRTNNTYEAAASCLSERLARIGLSHVEVGTGRHDAVCDPLAGRLFEQAP